MTGMQMKRNVAWYTKASTRNERETMKLQEVEDESMVLEKKLKLVMQMFLVLTPPKAATPRNTQLIERNLEVGRATEDDTTNVDKGVIQHRG